MRDRSGSAIFRMRTSCETGSFCAEFGLCSSSRSSSLSSSCGASWAGSACSDVPITLSMSFMGLDCQQHARCQDIHSRSWESRRCTYTKELHFDLPLLLVLV